MASLSNKYSSFKTATPVVENNNDRLSKFRRRNKITIIVLTTFVVSLTLIIGALITYLVQEDTDHQLSHKSAPLDNPVIFYSDPCNAPPCWRMYNTITTTKYVMDPARIFTLTLQKSIEDLESLVSSTRSDGDDKTAVAALNNCSESLRGVSGRIQSLFRINPFFFIEKRGEAVELIMGVEVDLEGACGGSDTGVRETVVRVKEYLRSCRENLFMTNVDVVVWEKFWGDFVAKWGMMFRSTFLMCVGGLQLLFMFFLFWTLFKFRCR